MRIRNTYILLVTIIGLFTLALYSTFAMFTASIDTDNFVNISASNLSPDTSMLEYERLVLDANSTKMIGLNINNKTSNSLYYGVWYEMIEPDKKNDDIVIAKLDESADETIGSITNATSKQVIIIIKNKTSNSVTVNIGVAYSSTSSLNLPINRELVTDVSSDAIDADDLGPKIYDFDYTGSVQSQELTKGKYKLEVWGAQGGSYDTTYYGGLGGYSYGTLTLDDKKQVFVYVGGIGESAPSTVANATTASGGFNGGGNGYSSTAIYASSGGGGASDIRLEQDSLSARLIVAGGGGGAASRGSNATRKYSGGVGGGTTGGDGGYYDTFYAGKGASGTAIGASYNGTTLVNSNTAVITVATFGKGASAGTNTSGIAGGGGGWYGGGAAVRASAGGGSGFVWTSATASNVPKDYAVSTNYYLTDAATLAGNTAFTSPSGANETGHSGDGHARITRISTIPSLKGLSDKTIALGAKVDLLSDVSCVDNGDGCIIDKVSITDTSILAEGEYTAYYIVKDNKGEKYRYSRKIKVNTNLDKSGANAPKLTDGLIPVMYDGTNWVKASDSNADIRYKWYNYSEKQWANAVLVTSTNRTTYVNASVGTIIPEADVLAYYVWIPRYKYKVWNINKVIGTDSYDAYHKGIDIIFEKGTASTGNVKCTNYSFAAPTSSSPNEICNGSNGEYYTHPAFTFGDKEVEGIWVGKFEVSGNTSELFIKPNVVSLTKAKVDEFYISIKNMQTNNNSYGILTDETKVDSHMIKNMEWGAVTYLTNSNYGTCIDGTCSRVVENSNTNFRTGGNNYVTHVNQSTTKNIYGIYDMSGCAWEYVMSNMSEKFGNYSYNQFFAGSNFIYTEVTAKYIDTYASGSSYNDELAYNRSRLGDATGEVVIVSETSWYNGYAYFGQAGPWFGRGGAYFHGGSAGIFFYYGYDGAANDYASSRASLIVF